MGLCKCERARAGAVKNPLRQRERGSTDLLLCFSRGIERDVKFKGIGMLARNPWAKTGSFHGMSGRGCASEYTAVKEGTSVFILARMTDKARTSAGGV